MENTPTDPMKSTERKPQTHKAQDHAEEPSKPSESRWGARGRESMSSGLNSGAIQPGNSNGASYP